MAGRAALNGHSMPLSGILRVAAIVDDLAYREVKGMPEAGYKTMAVLNDVWEQFTEYKRQKAAALHKDLTFSETLAELLKVADRNEEVKVT
jgi:hypothetical protein